MFNLTWCLAAATAAAAAGFIVDLFWIEFKEKFKSKF